MATIQELYKNSLFSLAAYANLSKDAGTNLAITSIQALKDAGMAETQAIDFASKWTVVDQYNGLSGVSATVFHNIAENKNYLAL